MSVAATLRSGVGVRPKRGEGRHTKKYVRLRLLRIEVAVLADRGVIRAGSQAQAAQVAVPDRGTLESGGQIAAAAQRQRREVGAGEVSEDDRGAGEIGAAQVGATEIRVLDRGAREIAGAQHGT